MAYPHGQLFISLDPARSNAVPLAGSTASGQVYVFLEAVGDIDSVAFFIDDPSRWGKPYQVERNSPYDLGGGSVATAKPVDLNTFGSGIHLVTAEISYSGGSTALVEAEFTVDYGTDSSVEPVTSTTSTTTATTPPPTEDLFLVSMSADRSGAVGLSGAVVGGLIYPYLEAEGEVSSVTFWLDDPGRSGSPFQVERNAPYDVAGGTVSTANPLDTSALSAGLHTVTADVQLADGSTRAVSVEFSVSHDGTTTTSSSSTTTTSSPPTTTTSSTTSTTSSTTTTTTSGSMPSGAVLIEPGQSIQAAVDRHPEGTTFVIAAGVHKNQRVAPKHGNTFIGEPGAVLDGGGSTEYAFGGSGDYVVIENLVIENYASPLGKGVIRSVNSGQDWTVRGNEIRNNKGIGIAGVKGWKVIGNHLHHNQQYGMRAVGPSILVEDNEIAYNNHDLALNPYSAAGGTKFLQTVGLVVRGNYVHHNGGPGLWTDGDNLDTLYEGNRVEANHHAGIKHEISCRAAIKGNTVTGNGFGNPNWLAGAGIVVLNSPDVTVSGNTVAGNEDGIGGIHADGRAKDGNNCRHELKNLKVTNNSITMSSGYTGIATNADSSVYDSWNNTFSSNTYSVASNGDYFQWKGGFYTLNEWLAMGMS